jgi:hypothetical protein
MGSASFCYDTDNTTLATCTALSDGTNEIDLSLATDASLYYKFNFSGTGTGAITSYTISEETVVSPCPPYIRGAGTTASPCQITNCTNLQNMTENLTAVFELMNDIDCSGTINWNNGQGFHQIGDAWGNRFSGKLDGNNYSINNIFINSTGTNWVGIFGYIDSGSGVSNVRIINATVYNNQSYVGALAGQTDSDIENCSVVNSTINALGSTGGLIGWFDGNTLKNCFSKGTSVTGTGNVGGLVGYVASPSKVINSYAVEISVSGSDKNVGGLAGASVDSIINKSFSSGTVINSGNRTGGLVGYTDDSFVSGKTAIQDSFSTCKVYGNDTTNSTNGLLGWAINVGGAAGPDISFEEYIINAFWYNNTNDNATRCHQNETSGGCTVKTTKSYFYSIDDEPMVSFPYPPYQTDNDGNYYPYLFFDEMYQTTIIDCSCPGSGIWNMPANCYINDDCDLESEDLNLSIANNSTINATISCANITYPSTDNIIYMDINAYINISG